MHMRSVLLQIQIHVCESIKVHVYYWCIYRHMTIWCTCKSNSYRGVHLLTVCPHILHVVIACTHNACLQCTCIAHARISFHAACTCTCMHALILDNHCESHAPCPLSTLTTYLYQGQFVGLPQNPIQAKGSRIWLTLRNVVDSAISIPYYVWIIN